MTALSSRTERLRHLPLSLEMSEEEQQQQQQQEEKEEKEEEEEAAQKGVETRLGNNYVGNLASLGALPPLASVIPPRGPPSSLLPFRDSLLSTSTRKTHPTATCFPFPA
ncbi:hypothetical protein E2C01_049599 [Portunus trituberculatus]|uniref:Uncharacterized protein n=1 Tax=Portunus trituberculatus TaxID=210409 RepID=A0A5B7GEB2_PORTR|nr:hypothetical protein [Portunus trituberculatus]